MAELKPILLVEDNPKDLELTLAALEQSQLANEVVVVRDGVEALDFLYRRGAHASRNTGDPAVVLLDLKLPKVDGLEVLETVKADPRPAAYPGRHADLVARGERSRAQLRARRQCLRGEAGGLPRILRRDPGSRRVLGHPQRTAAAAQRSLGAPMDRASANHSDRALRILLLEDSALDAELVTEALLAADLRIALERVVSAEEFTDAIHGGPWDLILADYLLPAFNGLNALDIAREFASATPFVFVSGVLGEEVAVEALKRGATDYVLKDKLERLPPIVLRALAEARERDEKRRAQDALQKSLDERTALLHELDHRVKNNLQLLLSLIAIEARQAEEEQVRQVLGRLKERMQALAAAHRDLYDGKGAARFDVSRFARGLCEELTASLRGVKIVPEFETDKVEVEAAKAAPMALLFNEIVVNALAQAYRERQGKLKLALRTRDGALLFQLSDDAFSVEEKQAARDGASGTILKALSRQLDADIDWPQDDPAILVRVVMPARDAG